MGKGVGRAADSRARALPAASPCLPPPACPAPPSACEQNRFRLCSYLGLRFSKALLALR